MPRFQRLLPLIALIAIGCAAQAAPAVASTTQESIMQDDGQLRADPIGTLQTMRNLGVTRVKVGVYWSQIAPAHRRTGFNGANPASYPDASWAFFDLVDRQAKADGLNVMFMLTGPAPLWAIGRGDPSGGPHGQWKPNAKAFSDFTRAIGTRYSGHYRPAGSPPRVSFWTIWNEPNYGQALAPQATNHDTIEVGAALYRGLVDAAWSGLKASGHGGDTILIGETAPHGFDHPIGNFNGDKPLRFLRALYCVDSRYRQLRGSAAAVRGCPTNSAGSRRFASAHGGLFKASGFAAHPYAQGIAPNQTTRLCGSRLCRSGGGGDPDFADLPVLARLERTLDRLTGAYGAHPRFPIWNTEYGYITNPPRRDAKVSPTKAALYINWAEYLSYKQPRVRSYSQYLLVDPSVPTFTSGLLFSNHREKPGYDAYRLPIFMPATSGRRGRPLEVWGGIRAAAFDAAAGSPQQVAIQFQRGSRGAFVTVKTLTVGGRRGYFDIRQAFSGSGTVQLSWRAPSGAMVNSRPVKLTIH